MNFGELLHTAKKNDQEKPQIRYYKSKFEPPKKEQRTKSLSVNVQKFLARKEAEEKQKREEAEERRSKLLALRSQDKKATRRVNVMLKRTKSANQSVIADATDSDNTAVTLAGPSQPDEDDYGYVSQESSALYNKMMEKYSKMPEEPKFPEFRKKVSTNLNSTKDRVKAALAKQEEEANMPHRRKRKHTTDSGGDPEKTYESIIDPDIEPEKKEPPKPKFKPAPLVNFSDLLKLAEKKQFEPVVIEPKKEEEERPLTKKQKKEMDREREWRERKESRNKMPPPDKPPPASNRIPKLNGSTSQVADKIPKKTAATGESSEFKKPQRPLSDQQNVHKALERNTTAIPKNNNNLSSKSSRPDNQKQSLSKSESIRRNELQQQKQRPLSESRSSPAVRHEERPRTDVKRDNYQIQKSRPPVQDGRPKMPSSSKDLQKKSVSPDNRMKMPVQQNGVKSKQIPSGTLKSQQHPSSGLKPKQFPPSDLKPKQFPPSDLKAKQFPPADLRKKFPPKDVKRKLTVNKGRIMDDDDEYDSEMDDFIDDGPEECEDYSSVISQMFGYDRRKYQYEEDDVDDMETSFAQQMKEEVISTKIGIMEDLEDMRQEEEDKKRKMLMKKRRKL